MPTPTPEVRPNSIAGIYEAASGDRDVYLTRAREAAKLTIPSLMLPEGSTGATDQYQPYQSVGSRGVKNLAAKLLLALFPPNQPFFRMAVDEFVLEDLSKNDADVKDTILTGLAKMEGTTQTYIEQEAIRVTLVEAILQLLVAGNVLLYVPTDGGSRIYPLTQYVVFRSPHGPALRIVIKEVVAKETLTEDQLSLLEDSTVAEEDPAKNHRNTIPLYTNIERRGEDGSWKVEQEINGKIVPGSTGSYPKDKCAYIPLRFRKIDGEDYGRGFVEEMIGDLRTLEGLNMAMVEGAAAMSKVLLLVNPNGLTSKKTISDSDNLSVRDGVAEDVTVLKVDKLSDFRFAFELAKQVEDRLSFSFLLNSAVRRNGERVTAEEIRFVAGELEDGLGGVYSLLSQEMQIPLVHRLLHLLTRKKKLPSLPKDSVKPEIVAGLEALGRSHELNKLDRFLESIEPEDRRAFLHMDRVYRKRAIAAGIDQDILKTQDELQAEQQNAMMSQLAEKALPNAVTQIGSGMREGYQQQNAPATPPPA